MIAPEPLEPPPMSDLELPPPMLAPPPHPQPQTAAEDACIKCCLVADSFCMTFALCGDACVVC